MKIKGGLLTAVCELPKGSKRVVSLTPTPKVFQLPAEEAFSAQAVREVPTCPYHKASGVPGGSSFLRFRQACKK